jgi:enoyl-CoA hydratase/carnithine racemase
MIKVTHHENVALLELDRSTTNPLSLECVEELAAAVRSVRSDPDVRGVVLSSSNDKFFSIGFDIPQLIAMGREEFQGFYRAFNRMAMELFTLPRPTVAALRGHAIAGGCILALCCDYRLIAEGRKLMGLNEVKLGVPVPYLADCILRSLVGVRSARDVMETGDFYGSEDLLAMGLVDQVVPLEEVADRALEKARLLGSMPPDGYGLIKLNRTDSVVHEVLPHWEARQEAFLDCWFSPEARKQLEEAMEKF